MAAISTFIAGASLAAGIGGAFLQNRAARKARKQQRTQAEAAARQQQEETRQRMAEARQRLTESHNAAALKGRDKQDTRIKLGASDKARRKDTAKKGTDIKGTASRSYSGNMDRNRTFGVAPSRIGGLR